MMTNRPQSNPPSDAYSVLVGVDSSASSRAALRWALRYAEHRGERVCAVTVWHQPVTVPDAAQMAPISPDSELEAQAKGWLDEAVADLPDSARREVRTRIESGDPRSVLLEMSRDASLLVLGNNHRGAVTGAIMGSVALSCVHHADCPVLLVPEEVPDGPPPVG